MSHMELAAVVLINLALVFYTLGVWAERIRRTLLPWHVVAFWTGLFFDASGTLAMDQLPHHHRPDRALAHAGPCRLGHAGGPKRIGGGPGEVPPLQPGGLVHLAGALLRRDVPGDDQRKLSPSRFPDCGGGPAEVGPASSPSRAHRPGGGASPAVGRPRM